jgi:hypothetical protein
MFVAFHKLKHLKGLIGQRGPLRLPDVLALVGLDIANCRNLQVQVLIFYFILHIIYINIQLGKSSKIIYGALDARIANLLRIGGKKQKQDS